MSINSCFEFQELPEEFRLMNKDDHTDLIQKLYSNFKFYTIQKTDNDKKEKQDTEFLLSVLKDSKFITYSFFSTNNIQPNIPDKEENKSQSINIISNIVICVEKKCIIIESISKQLIKNIFSKLKASFINVTNPFDKQNQNSNDIIAIEEVQSFCSHLNLQIKINKFIKVTFYSILSYLIRRHFYPSYYFKDQSFFFYNEKITPNSFKNEIHNFLKDDKLDFTIKIDQFKTKMKNENEKKKQKKEESYQLINFKSNDFLLLRSFYINEYSVFYLTIHIESLHLFVMKVNKKFVTTHEIEFCKFLSKHPNQYFTKCYGFIKEKDEITAVIYQFMSNGSLDTFLKQNKKQFNEIFAFTTACRIFEGISYLNKNSLVHRDLKPSNILIDHDGKAYISDFETIRLFDSTKENFAENEFSIDICSLLYSPPEQIINTSFNLSTDIYTYGEIVYFLFEKKDVFNQSSKNKSDNIPEMKVNLKYIKDIYNSCVVNECSNRSSIEKIQSNLFSQFDSFSFLNCYFLNDFQCFTFDFLIQYFSEIFNLILEYNNDNQLNNLINNHLFSFLFLNSFKNMKKSDLLFILGTFFYHGIKVNKSYHKVIKCFKLSSEDKNLNAILALGDLNYNGLIIPKNKDKAESLYSELKKSNKNDAHLYFDYFYEYLNDVQIEYYIFKQHVIFSDELHNSYVFTFLEYLYSEVYGIKNDFFEDHKKEKTLKNIDLLNKLEKSTSFLFLGHILYYGKRNDPSYFGHKEYSIDFSLFDFNNDETGIEKYTEFLNIKGYLYFNGVIYEQNDDKARYYYELAESKNNDNACLNLGNIYYKDDFLRSKYYYQKSSESNNSHAFLYLANLYYKRKTTEDFNKSREYTKKSADLNNPNALNLLGFMYYRGIGGEQNYSTAKHYYKLGLKQDYAYSASNLGFFYRKGVGCKQSYLKSMKYYEIASKQFVSNALYQVGTYLFNGEGVDMNIQKAIQIFLTNIKVYNEKVLFIFLRPFFELKNSSVKLDRMALLAYNDLGVIYTIEPDYFNQEKAQFYFIEAGFSEYVHGQNNYGLFYQFFLNQIEKAEHLFQKAANKNFALSEYNLGYLHEINGDVDKSMKFYYNASEHENNEVLLYDENIFDNRLEISKTFIICMTKLKLVLYYLSKSDLNMAKYFFVNAFSQLEKKYKQLRCVFDLKGQYEYKFQFKFFDAVQHQNIFMYLKYFIFNFPLFNLRNQKNIDLNNDLLQMSTSNSYMSKSDMLIEFDDIIKKVKLTKNKSLLKNKKEDEENVDDGCDDDDISVNEKPKKDFDGYDFNDLEFLFHFACSNEMKELFVDEIKEIVNEMHRVIYTYPYPILFGRIWLHQSNEKNKNIDKLFYDGFKT